MESEKIYKFMTPVEVWKNFDPVAEPLEEERIRTKVEGDLTYETIYFTAKSVGEKKVRVLVRTCRSTKAKGKKPTLLVAMPCLKKEPDLSLFKSVLDEGYVLATFDYEGKVDGKLRYTLYPQELSYCNDETAGEAFYHAEPSAHHTTWYNWTVIARRTITLISTLEYVDSDKIVMIGEGEGCALTWQVAAMDTRLKGACTIFGYNLEYRDGDPEERDCWVSGVDMRSYASYVNIPFLHIGATNKVDDSFDTLLKVAENVKNKEDFYTDFAFGYEYGLSNRQMKAFYTFLDKVFEGEKFAETPVLDVVANEGELCAKVLVENAKHAEVWYAYGSEAEKRLWKKVDCTKKNGVYTAKIDLSVPDEILRIFGRVSYGKYSVCSSSKVVVPATIGIKCLEKRRTKVLYDSALDNNELLPVSISNVMPDDAVTVEEGAVGLKGATSLLEGLAYVKNPETIVDFKTAESLQIEYYCMDERNLVVKLYMIGGKTYTTEVALSGAEGWQRVLLATSVFKDESYKKMLSWDGVWKIEILGLKGALINKMLVI